MDLEKDYPDAYVAFSNIRIARVGDEYSNDDVYDDNFDDNDDDNDDDDDVDDDVDDDGANPVMAPTYMMN